MTNSDLQGFKKVLEVAALDDQKTVLIGLLNKAWCDPGGMFDTFLESFDLGEGISYLLKHMVIVAVDSFAYEKCIHAGKVHCFQFRFKPGVNFSAEQVSMAPDYLKLVNLKTYLLALVLQYDFNFIFTDIDIVWFRPPFRHFSKHADFESACEVFNNNSSDIANLQNTGFLHVVASNRTRRLFDLWLQMHRFHPGLHDQDVFYELKKTQQFKDLDLSFNFMPTVYFGGFCTVSSDLEKVCTNHATCCVGLTKKLAGQKQVLEDWKLFKSMTPYESRLQGVGFKRPSNCH
ncbi:uncharacterized protein At4g15970-like [Selaginella moellendorffii]|uniref:uncharacterized protein At4g15970-like n=1 Tax=Selaginella moellendorffii TaxID=88036 RepID=UPI000D1C267E|nr:uncharacterized protein At4g15970-like [Selaginella moellendorffii]|eukprot:XP_024533419.1 uncharacterized protein At4g15970-like [Selaginella moellendorffii]